MKFHRGWALLLLAVFSGGCQRCGLGRTPQVQGPAAYLPKDVRAAVVVPDLARLGQELSTLQKLKAAGFAAQLQGFSSSAEAMEALVSAAGVDLRNPAELKKAGVDPSFGLGVALKGERDGFVVLRAKDPVKLKAWILRLVEQRWGALAQKPDQLEGAEVTRFARRGEPPLLALAMRDQLAWVASGPSAFQLQTLLRQKSRASLAEDAPYATSLQRLAAAHPNPPEVIVHLPITSEWAKRFQLPGVTFALDLTPAAVTVNADIPWPHTQSSLGVLDRVSGPNLLPQLPSDAFLVARFGGDPQKLTPFLPFILGSYWEQALLKAQVNVGRDVLNNLQSGAVMGFSLAPTVQLSEVPELDLRRTNPFHYVQLLLLSKVKDAEKGRAFLERLPLAAPAFGAKMEKSVRAGRDVLLTRYAQGEGIHLALVSDTVIAGSPLARFEAALAQKGGGNRFADPQWALPFEQKALAAHLDLQKLSSSIAELPEDAWGPGGMFIKDAWLRWMEGMKDLRAISFSLASAKGAVEGELSLHLTPP